MRPTPGQIETRTGELVLDGRRIRSRVPFGVESRDLGGFREVIEPTALQNADMTELVARVEHAGLPLARHPYTLSIDRSDGSWSFEPPQSRQDVVEAVERGDLRSSSFRMIVAPGGDEWRGDVRHVRRIKALRDVSLVALPAYEQAELELRSHEQENTVTDEVITQDQEAPETTEPTDTPDEAAEAPQEPEDRSEPEPRPGRLQVEDRREDGIGETRVMSELAAAIHRVPGGESRALADSISIAPTAIGQVLFDKLRAQAVVLGSGLRVMGISSKAETWPTITGDVAPAMYSEAGAITPGDPTFGTITATPRKLAHLVQLDNEVIDDSSPAVVGVLNDHLLRLTALKLDQQLLEGSGTPPQVTGLKNVGSIQSDTGGAGRTNGAAVTFDFIMGAIALLDAISIPRERIAVIGHTRNLATLTALRSIANGEYLWDTALQALGMTKSQFHWTSQLTVTETQGTNNFSNSIYVFDTQNVIFVPRTSPTIVLDRSRLFNSDQSELRFTQRFDLIVPQPTAVVRSTGYTS